MPTGNPSTDQSSHLAKAKAQPQPQNNPECPLSTDRQTDTRLTVHCVPESSNTNGSLHLSLSLTHALCLATEFLSIFSRSLVLVSTKPFLQYWAWGMPFLLHSAAKFHSSFILRWEAEDQLFPRVNNQVRFSTSLEPGFPLLAT